MKLKLITIVFAVLISLTSFAYAENVVISQLLYNPAGPEDKEWVELYNPTNTAVNIGNWKIYSFSNSSPDATIPSGRIIQPKSYFLIGDTAWNASWPAPNYIEALFITNTNTGV